MTAFYSHTPEVGAALEVVNLLFVPIFLIPHYVIGDGITDRHIDKNYDYSYNEHDFDKVNHWIPSFFRGYDRLIHNLSNNKLSCAHFDGL
jgi:hypothetical protein